MEKNDKILPIFDENNKLASFFVKANSFLLCKYSHLFDEVLDEKQKNHILEQLWLDVFDAKIKKSNNCYDRLVFTSRYTKSLFFLKLK